VDRLNTNAHHEQVQHILEEMSFDVGNIQCCAMGICFATGLGRKSTSMRLLPAATTTTEESGDMDRKARCRLDAENVAMRYRKRPQRQPNKETKVETTFYLDCVALRQSQNSGRTVRCCTPVRERNQTDGEGAFGRPSRTASHPSRWSESSRCDLHLRLPVVVLDRPSASPPLRSDEWKPSLALRGQLQRGLAKNIFRFRSFRPHTHNISSP
jgi:hypothetical protein